MYIPSKHKLICNRAVQVIFTEYLLQNHALLSAVVFSFFSLSDEHLVFLIHQRERRQFIRLVGDENPARPRELQLLVFATTRSGVPLTPLVAREVRRGQVVPRG